MEEPQNTTVTENVTASFRCSITNSSFRIFWRVNHSDAALTQYYEIGIRIIPINATTSGLNIPGKKSNNNTIVQCIAFLYHDYAIIGYTASQTVFLNVHDPSSTWFRQETRTCSNGKPIYSYNMC